MKKRKSWSRKQLKKARWKRSLARASKREHVYGRYVVIDDILSLLGNDK